jgi:hypothetical protein
MKHQKTLLALALLASAATTGTAQAQLTAGTAVGQSVVYSSISNVTWTGDANLLGTLEASNPNLVNTIISTIGSISDTPNSWDTTWYSGIHTLSKADFGANGLVTWFGAQALIQYLNTINYAGTNQWALPSAGVDPQIDYNQTGTQFGQLFYNELAGIAGGAIPNTANFANEQTDAYWLGLEYAPNPDSAWYFDTNNGIQGGSIKHSPFYAWAVSPGTITGFTASAVPAAVPVPGAVWLFGSGLIGLTGFARKRKESGLRGFHYLQ